MNHASIASQVRAIAALSEHIDAAPPDVGVIDALVAARTLVELVQVRSFSTSRGDVAMTLEPAIEIIDDALGRL